MAGRPKSLSWVPLCLHSQLLSCGLRCLKSSCDFCHSLAQGQAQLSCPAQLMSTGEGKGGVQAHRQ